MSKAFTLIELLVVVTIIVVLLALLVPAMDKAIDRAERAVCLVNQRSIVQGCQFYAMDNRGAMPLFGVIGDAQKQGSAYDLRNWRVFVDVVPDSSPLERVPLGFGLLPTHGYLPATKLGKVIHCVSLDNKVAGPYAGIGMDAITSGSVGGSWWVDPAYKGWRVVGGYSYRGASYGYSGKGNLKLSKMEGAFVVSVDNPDMRFGGLKYGHPDGYQRAFGDGSASFMADPKRDIEQAIQAINNNANTAGEFAGGGNRPAWAAEEELVWERLAHEGR